MGDANRRKSTRVPFKATVDLIFDGREYLKRQTSDLSLTSVFVPGVTGHEAGETCRLNLHLTGLSSDILLHMKGRIQRVEQDGIGLEFFEIDLDSFYHLKNIVYYNSGDPDKLEDEFFEHVRKSGEG